jgi:hypothetical protein
MDMKLIEKKIFDHYWGQLDNRKITSGKVGTYDADNNEYSNCVRDIQERLKVKLKRGGIYSTVLLHQLSRHKCQLGEMFNDKVEYYNSSEILDLIEYIEQGKVDKRCDLFKHEPLKGLYKIHHGAFSGLGFSLILNIFKYWFDEKARELHAKRRADFENIVNKFRQQNLSGIAQQMHSKAILTLTTKQKLTGEWLIFDRKDGINRYLCLATHDEGDKYIFDNKIQPCYLELN